MDAAANDRYALWALALLAVLATALLSCRVTPSPGATPAPDLTPSPKPTTATGVSPVAPSPPASPLTDVSPLKQAGKLSPRLQLLASPDLSGQSAEAQARALGLPASGPGSLMRNERGEVLVYIRMLSVTESDVAALVGAGAAVVHTAADALTVTAYVHPSRLNELAGLDRVLNVYEEVMPK